MTTIDTSLIVIKRFSTDVYLLPSVTTLLMLKLWVSAAGTNHVIEQCFPAEVPSGRCRHV